METAISIGNFDGVHLGHLYLLERLKEEAFKRNLKPLVITFEPHPAEVLKKNGNFCKILTGEEKREIIEGQLGIETVVLPFTENFSRVLPEEFVKDYLINRFNAKVVVVGYDWHFGRDASGDFILLSGICKKFGCEALKVEPYTVGGKIVSSTLIRGILKEAKLKEASLYLGHPYWIRRRRVPGKGLGSKLGFPTMNFKGVDKLCLPEGVYAVCIEGRPAVANLGYAPTLKGERDRTLEVHILRNPYGVSDFPKIVFKRYLRREYTLETVEDLMEQIRRDIKIVKTLFLAD